MVHNVSAQIGHDWAVPRLTFIRPLSPNAAVRLPKGNDWLHEPKWDGFRFQIVKDGERVHSERLPRMLDAFHCAADTFGRAR
jgi:ATP-dependent DNA ligase